MTKTPKFFASPYTGEQISIKQIHYNKKAATSFRDHSWLCLFCKHLWKGHRRVYKENRKPPKCPKCSRRTGITQV